MKQFSRFSLTLFLLFFVSIASASAALPQTFNNVLRIIAQPLQVLFVVLPASSAFPYLLKFLYFIILAALWSGIASQITKDREGGVKRAFKIFGVIVALVSAIFIPQSWLMYAFKIPAMISIVLFFLVVPLGGYFLCHRLITGDTPGARIGRAFIWWVIGVLVLALVDFIQTHPDPALQQMISPVLDALEIGAIIALGAGFANLFMGLGGGTAAEAVVNRIRGRTRGETAEDARNVVRGGRTHGAEHEEEEEPSPAEMVELRGLIRSFIIEQAGGPGSIQTIFGQVEEQYQAQIQGQPASPARQAAAQAILHFIEEQHLEERQNQQRERAHEILHNHHGYTHVPEEERTQFETTAANFLGLQTRYTILYTELLRAA